MKVHFTNSSYKEYQKLPIHYKTLLNNTLDKLKSGLNIDLKPLQGEKDTYRIRFGKYRALFIRIAPDILIIRIDTRGDVYK